MDDFGDVVESIKELASNQSTGKTWTSYGQVIQDADGAHSVRFNDSGGSPLAHGVLVDVKLQPSGNVVPCRVANQCAGDGEGEWHPFIGGDEVLVVIPEGDERSGCVIIGRLNQSHDVFPTTVAGMDVTQNNFAFKRLVAPFVTEVGASWMVRSATTGASLTLDQTGQIFLSDADGTLLAMTPDVVSLMLAGEAAGLQIDVTNQQVNLIAGKTNLQVAEDASALQTGGTLSLATMGSSPSTHVATVEGMVTFVTAIVTGLGALVIPPLAPPEVLALVNVALGLVALNSVPVTPFAAGIIGALSAKMLPPVGGPLVSVPIGTPGLTVG